MPDTAKRQPRIRIVDPDGVEHVQDKRPRVDVLDYPNRWVGLLVRFTHNRVAAAALALEHMGALGEVLEHVTRDPWGCPDLWRPPGELAPRVVEGWWTTRPASEQQAADRDQREGLDADHRIVTPSTHRDHGAGAGVQFIAGRRPA